MTGATAEQMDEMIRGIGEIKKDIAEFRREVAGKLEEQWQKVSGELKKQGARITELEERVSETEDWRAEMGDLMLEQVERTRVMQERLLDLQARSMRNNIRIFNCPEEETEGKNMTEYLEELLKTGLDLPTGMELGIMRAHRALVPKSRDINKPRAIVANFLQFDVKEVVLRKAWATEIKVDGKRIGFDHDYPQEVVRMRKEYVPMKRTLKKEGIPFSSPFTKLRVRWPDGTETYATADEADRAIQSRLAQRAREQTRRAGSAEREGGSGDGTTAEPTAGMREDKESEQERGRPRADAEPGKQWWRSVPHASTRGSARLSKEKLKKFAKR